MNNSSVNIDVIWLGQGGFVFVLDEVRIVIDPYLSDSLAEKGFPRMIPIPVKAEDLDPDYVLITHDHADHFDEETMLSLTSLYPECIFIGPESVRNHYSNMRFDADHFVLLNKGMQYEGRGFTVKAVPAYHTDDFSVGFIISSQDKQIYITGDTLLDSNLIPELKSAFRKDPDLLMICINGKLGNMSDEEAIELVKAVKPAITIPMHYGMFEANTVDPTLFFSTLLTQGYTCELMTPGIIKTIEL